MVIEGEIEDRKRKTQNYRLSEYMVQVRKELPDCASNPDDESLRKCYIDDLDVRGAVLLFT